MLTSLLLCVAVVAVVSSQRSASRAENATDLALQVKTDADKAAADRAAEDQATAAKAAAAAHDKKIADAAAKKALADKAAKDKATKDKAIADGKRAQAGPKATATRCEQMKANGYSYYAAEAAWSAANFPSSWDVDHDGWPCEHAYGERN